MVMLAAGRAIALARFVVPQAGEFVHTAECNRKACFRAVLMGMSSWRESYGFDPFWQEAAMQAFIGN